MKASMYFNYASRSLLRGGQRTILAIFCVAVGVMSIVSLQLVGFMLQSSLTANVRDANGGDISVSTPGAPFSANDLSFFNQLKNAGTVTDFSALSTAGGGLSPVTPSFQTFSVEAVDPARYPLVSAPTFVAPDNGRIADLLTNDRVIVTQNFLDRYGKKVGDSFAVYVKTNSGTGRTMQVTIAGVIANAGGFAQAGNLLLISAQDYQAAAPDSPTTYSVVDITTVDAAHTGAAIKAINRQFPLAATQTVADVLKTQQASVDTISKFLEVAGLLALLIGGVGIINTMQVLLSRRKIEIATLKTTGYRRLDLSILFGLEASLLGLIGGVIGAAMAIGVSAIVRWLMENLGINLLFLLDPWLIAGGAGLGFVSALIFGLMPIVQAANIRPLHVIREMPEHRDVSSIVLTCVLLILFSVLFCTLAIVILKNDVVLGIEAVYGALAFLLLLGLFFSLVMLVVSKLPVPEHLNMGYVSLVLVGIAAAVLLYQVLPAFGVILLGVVVLGVVIAFASSSWKVSTKMALRNIGRRRTRTTTTAVALFVGIFTIGLVVALGQGLQGQISVAFTQDQYNVFAITSGTDSTTLRGQINTIPGLARFSQDVFTQSMPIAVNGEPLQQVLPTNAQHRQEALNFLNSLEGYDLTATQPALKITSGRNLNATDAGTNNVVIIDQITSTGSDQMNLKPGDTLTFASVDGRTQRMVTIVGIYTGAVSVSHVGFVIAPAEVVNALSPAKTGAATITYMKIDAAQVNHALDSIGRLAPDATVQNLADAGAAFAQQLNSFLDMLVAIASLSMIAGVIIIANSVALAMLERRRELGILKAVGYTSGTVLREVLIENGITATIGAFSAMLLAAGGVALLGRQLFNLSLSVAPWIVSGLIGGSALLAMLTAGLVAWNAVRVRPLEVLRYE